MVIDLQKYKLLQELLSILEETHISPLQATVLLDTLYEGKTLATALRTIGLRSAYEIPSEILVRLRSFRSQYFPDVCPDQSSSWRNSYVAYSFLTRTSYVFMYLKIYVSHASADTLCETLKNNL